MRPLTFKTRLTIMVVAVLGFARSGSGQQNQTEADPTIGEPVQQITLEEAIRIAVQNNLALTTDAFSRLAARESRVIADADYEPVASVTMQRAQSQQASLESDIDASSQTSFRTSAQIQQRIDTGATLTLSTSPFRQQQQSSISPSRPQYRADVELSVRQPLLNGAGITVNRITRRQAELAVARSDIVFRGRVMDIVQATEIAFLNLVSAQEQVQVRRSAVTAAERLVQENEARQGAGLATELDVMQARVGLANSQSSLLQAEQALRDAADQLLATLGSREFTGMVESQYGEFIAPTGMSIGRSYGLARENDSNLLAAQNQLIQLELDARRTGNQRLPQVDLTGALSYSGRETGTSIRGAYDLIPEGDSYNWQLGLTVNLPWGMHAARARARNAQYTVEEQKALIAELEQNLLLNVRAAVRAIETSVRSVEIAELSTEFSAREYELEKARFDSGLSTSRLVVEAQQRGDEQKVSETQSRVQLKQNEARLRRIEGTSLDQFNVEVPPVE